MKRNKHFSFACILPQYDQWKNQQQDRPYLVLLDGSLSDLRERLFMSNDYAYL